ncbi:MAG: hypothetical protein GYB33_13015 [Gammaproteobacteria bacterium]|uniref:hypothetical protein n=1 Tax=Pseudomaricurvus alcaniphilus TaxID=1166482 RepID=UPI00140A4FD5|nr:hypothetical protein [Pseudomaricurvus alcaniphilus]MBR9911262.1 hypothetical protein [Gammaproteobacteria bacterium]NHN37643.1 hypothetical protein [Pseudomaricurvus alcaniphilus]
MKYFALSLLVLVVAGSGYLWLTADLDVDASRSVPAAINQSPTASGGAIAGGQTIESRRSALQQVETSPADSSTAPAVTREQEIAALEKEQELLQMAEQYETVRSDPDKREAHRQAMKEKLAAYSDAVLPIAMEKARLAQEAAK